MLCFTYVLTDIIYGVWNFAPVLTVEIAQQQKIPQKYC